MEWMSQNRGKWIGTGANPQSSTRTRRAAPSEAARVARPMGPAAQNRRRRRSADEESGPPSTAQRRRASVLQEVPSEARPLARAEAAAVATVHVQDVVVLELKEASTQTDMLEEPTTQEALRNVAMTQSSATESGPSTTPSPA